MRDKLPDISRRMTGMTLLLPLIAIFLAGKPFSQIIVFLCGIVMVFEYCFLITKNTGSRFALIALICCFGLTRLFFVEPQYQLLHLALIAAILFRFFPYRTSAMGLILASLLYSIGKLWHYPFFQEVMAYIIVTVISVDIGAYIVGRFLGGPKLMPVVSPAKTISGAIGGLVGGLMAGLSICYFLNIAITKEFIFLTLAVAVLAQAGDMTESIFKRSVNIKDSAKIIPGHGGFMDRFDGYLYVVPLFAFSPAQGLFFQ